MKIRQIVHCCDRLIQHYYFQFMISIWYSNLRFWLIHSWWAKSIVKIIGRCNIFQIKFLKIMNNVFSSELNDWFKTGIIINWKHVPAIFYKFQQDSATVVLSSWHFYEIKPSTCQFKFPGFSLLIFYISSASVAKRSQHCTEI